MRRLDLALLLMATVSLPALGSAQAAPTRLVLATNEDAVEMEVGVAVLQEAYRRLDITLDIRRLGGDIALRRGTQGVVRNGMLSSFLLYHYLNRRHAALVPRIEQVLKDMLLDGTIARIRERTVARLRSGVGVR